MTLLTPLLKELEFGTLYATLLAYLDIIEEKIGGDLPDEPFRGPLEGLEAPLVAEIDCFTLIFSLPFGRGLVNGHPTYRVLSHFDLKEVSHGGFQRFRIICVMLSVEYLHRK